MSQKTFTIAFYVRKDRVDYKETVPVFMRITVSGQRANIALNRRISLNKWKYGNVIGSTAEAKEIRSQMNSYASRAKSIRNDLLDRGEIVSAKIVKDVFLGNDSRNKSLVEVFEFHNKRIESLLGKSYSKSTLVRYKTTLSHVKDFMTKYYKRDDVLLKELNFEFISRFEDYLRVDRQCNHNSTVKYIKNLRKIINMAVDYEYLLRDPFAKYRAKIKPVEREYLSADELKIILNKEFKVTRLDQVRDVFMFCCYTGLAFVDVEKLKRENIVKGNDGELWIKTFRQKTDTKSMVPLLPVSHSILEKYNYAEKQNGEKILPVPTNQKMNAYLKEIADLCEINKNLTSHLGRHTFATTVTLSNNVPIETVSAMLGHKSLRTTQIYAKVLEDKVSRDMAQLRNAMS